MQRVDKAWQSELHLQELEVGLPVFDEASVIGAEQEVVVVSELHNPDWGLMRLQKQKHHMKEASRSVKVTLSV